MRTILASASPRRQELLRLITDTFEVHPVDADETLPAGMPVDLAPSFLADVKAQITPDMIEADIKVGKAVDFVKANAVITDKAPEEAKAE